VIGVVSSCGGQSEDGDDDASSGSAGKGGSSAQAGNGGKGGSGGRAGGAGKGGSSGAAGSKSSGGNAGISGNAGVGGGGGVSFAGGAGGAGGEAGEGGFGGSGGSGGALPCGCEETCVTTPSGFCPGYLSIGCPLLLENAQVLPSICKSDGHDLVYSDCDGHATFTFYIGGENDYDLVFSEDTGALVYGYANLYADECNSITEITGTPLKPTGCRSCTYCARISDEDGAAGAAGEGGAGGIPRCDLDEDGRVLPP
jgi:hypothetical protein